MATDELVAGSDDITVSCNVSQVNGPGPRGRTSNEGFEHWIARLSVSETRDVPGPEVVVAAADAYLLLDFDGNEPGFRQANIHVDKVLTMSTASFGNETLFTYRDDEPFFVSSQVCLSHVRVARGLRRFGLGTCVAANLLLYLIDGFDERLAVTSPSSPFRAADTTPGTVRLLIQRLGFVETEAGRGLWCCHNRDDALSRRLSQLSAPLAGAVEPCKDAYRSLIGA